MLVVTLLAAVALPLTAHGQERKSGKGKPASPTRGTPKTQAPQITYEQHLAAQLKLLGVLRRYAEILSEVTNAEAAGVAVARVEAITKEVAAAAEALVKLGPPTPEIEARLAKDPDLEVTSLRVAEQTRVAVKTLADDPESRVLLTPAIEGFQAALDQAQREADHPAGAPAKKEPVKGTAGPKPPETPVKKPDAEAEPPAGPAETARTGK